ncbi:lipase maturation factor family protein [Geomonas sp. RF6]|uniref:lipase maturation factor family protein n=1 Tax=Geomonas sp. RF6 TaxID=2897342 RepID=UPI001E2A4426|nr:lipase maturation factor family protein [Geomonas sp. RF6]UFS69594.1 lipase maturation factor family protein [Geomonas sp. RF6]
MTWSVQHFLPWLFPKLLGGVYCIAFASLLWQVLGLYGSRGILPISEYLGAVRDAVGKECYTICPTLFWLNSGDNFLFVGCLLGVALSLLLLVGFSPLPLLIMLWLLYISYTSAGQEFLGYQWDALLLETGFMTIFLSLAPDSPPLVVFTYRFFLFRFMFSSGMVKLLSGDRTWRDLTALVHHYHTQPLPNRIGWYAGHLPVLAQRFSTFGTFFFELIVPFLALGSQPARLLGFWLFLGFQGLIFATGNYAFFNILTAVLAVSLLDDELLHGIVPPNPTPGPDIPAPFTTAIFAVFLALNICQLLALFYRPKWLNRVLSALAPFHISNHYGLFAVMTTHRFEFIIEGSNDKKEWRPYEFRWKPGDPHRAPGQVAPHQPRLDWQMWFAALDPRSLEPWLANLVLRLLKPSPHVLRLLKTNPFPDSPPIFIRISVYSYRFSDHATKRRDGVWWERKRVGHFPPMSL